MWIISQEGPAVEITHFEKMSLNNLCPRNPKSLIEGRLLEGEKGLAYWCMPAITFLPTLCFSFSLFSFSRFCYFAFPFFSF